MGVVAAAAACDAFSSSDPAPGGSPDASINEAAAPAPDGAPADGAGADAGPRCGAPASSGLFFCDDFSEPDSGAWLPLTANGTVSIEDGALVTVIQNDTSGGALALLTRTVQLGTAWTTVRVQTKVSSFDVTLLDAGAPAADAGPEAGVESRADIATLLQVVDERDYSVVLAAGGKAPHRLYVFAESQDGSTSGAYSSGPALGPGARVTLVLKYGPAPLQISVLVDDKPVSLTPTGTPTFPVISSVNRITTNLGVFTQQKHLKATARFDDVEIETRP